MSTKYIGLIFNTEFSQANINLDHVRELGDTLSNYKIRYYNISNPADVQKIIHDRQKGKLDFVFNNSAGKKGGDGTVEGFLEVLGIPYVGSDVLATSAAFDKKTTKSIVADYGVPVVRDLTFTREQFEKSPKKVVKLIEEQLRYPVVVKASQGSDSIGVSLVRKADKIVDALTTAFAEDDRVIVEDFIKRKAEVTCWVLGNGQAAVALTPIERVYEGDILLSIDTFPRTYRLPDLPAATIEKIKMYSINAHNALGCSDYSRSDYLVGKTGRIYFLELNAHAGLGAGGTATMAAKETFGWTHPQFVKEILSIAEDRVRG